jgi:hypothetical protein
LSPQELEGIDTILNRTEQRIVRQRSLSSFSGLRQVDSTVTPSGCESTEKLQQEGNTHHGRTSVLHHQTPVREPTLHNIAETDDVLLDENMTESPV